MAALSHCGYGLPFLVTMLGMLLGAAAVSFYQRMVRKHRLVLADFPFLGPQRLDKPIETIYNQHDTKGHKERKYIEGQ